MSNLDVREETWLGRRGVIVRDDDLAKAWSTADEFAKSIGKKVIQNEAPMVLRRDNRVHRFFPFDPPESAPPASPGNG